MPKMTYRQWDEYKAIIKKCQRLEIDAISRRALKAQVAALAAQLEAERKGHYESDLALRADRDSIAKAFREMTAASQDADEDLTVAAKHRSQLMERVTALTAQVAKLEAVLLDVLDNTNTSGLQWWFLPGELKPETLLQLNLTMLEADKETPHA